MHYGLMLTRASAQFFKYFTPLLAAPAALLVSQGEAQAVLIYNIYESAGDVVIQTSGQLNLSGANFVGSDNCGADGGISSFMAIICTGLDSFRNVYSITGPFDFNGSVFDGSGNSSSLTSTYVAGSNAFLLPGFGITPNYISGAPIVSTSVFFGQSLAGLGFTINSGLLGSWTLDGTNETIYACLGPNSCAPQQTPGPLPLLGAGAAFGWSRRLRRRIPGPLITPPQA